MTRVIHAPIEQMVMSIPGRILVLVTVILTVYIVADFTLSFKTALDLRDILIKIERAKEELERMQRRLDVIVAFNNEEKEFRKQEREERRELWMSELTAGLERWFAAIKETLKMPSAYGESVREEIAELRGRFSEHQERQKNESRLLDFYKRDMIRNNPTMESKKYRNAFEELKKMANAKHK